MDKQKKHAAMSKIHAVEAALRNWDPIGVLPGETGPADEYDSYAPHIVSLVTGGCTAADLTAYLGRLRTETMGLPKDWASDSCAAETILKVLRSRA